MAIFSQTLAPKALSDVSPSLILTTMKKADNLAFSNSQADRDRAIVAANHASTMAALLVRDEIRKLVEK